MKIKSILSLLLLFCGLAGASAQVVLTESFNVTANTNTPPTGWTINTDPNASTNGCFTTDIEQVPSGGFVCPKTSPLPVPTANSGSGMAGYNSWDISQYSWSDLISPSLNFSGLGSYVLDYYVFEQQAFYGRDSLRVLINTSPTSTGATLLAAYVPNYNPPTSYGWAHYTINIPTTFNGANNYIIFRTVSDYGYDIFFDDITVTKIPPTPCAGTPLTPSISNTVMTSPLCTGSSTTLNAVDPNLPVTSGITYQWETSASGSGPWAPVSGGSGPNTLSYTTPTLTTSTWYRMALTCSASATTIYTDSFLVQVGAPQPSAISGSTTFCPGDTEIYSVTAAPSTTYNWTLPAGWTGSSTSDSIHAVPVGSSGAVTISVTATDACGTSIPQTLIVSPGSAPSPPSGINGNALFCANTTQTYTVPPVSGAMYYVWTLPSGWVGTSNTDTIIATNTINSGSITVRAVNGCGQSLATVLHVNSITSLDPIPTIFGNDTVCSGALNTYYINAVPGATSYIWTLPMGWSGTTTDTLIKVFPGTATGSISVTAYVSCATTSPKSKTVKVIPSVVPTVTLAAQSGTLCSGQPTTITATSTGGGTAPSFQWYKNSLAITASGSTYVTNSLVPGDVLQVIMTSNEVCANPVQVTSNALAPVIVPSVIPGININSTPGDAVCTGTMLYFTSNSTGTGTAPSYQWQKNGVDIFGAVGTSYSASNLKDGDTITVTLISNATCAPVGGVTSNKIGLIIRDTLVPQVSISVSPGNVINIGDEVTFSTTPVNGGSTPTYQWFRNGVTIPFETNASYTTTALLPGDHISVRMLSYLDCAYPRAVMSNEITLQGEDLSVGSYPGAGTFSIYPNPTRGSLHIRGDLSNLNGLQGLRAEIMNTVGQVVYRVEFQASAVANWEKTIELPANLAGGQYLLQLRSTSSNLPVQTTSTFQLVR